jgi:hypothetical protein
MPARKPRYDLTENVYYTPPARRASNPIVALISYLAVIAFGGLAGAGVVLGVLLLFLRLGLRVGMSQGDAGDGFFRGAIATVPWVIAGGAVVGAAIALGFLVIHNIRSRVEDARRRRKELARQNQPPRYNR